MKTILVTGGAGFIGSNLTERLLSEKRYKNFGIVCVDNLDDFYDIKFKKANIAPFKKDERFVFYKTDIRDNEALKWIFKKHDPETVIHLAAKVNTRNAVVQPRIYQEVNVDGTINLLELSKEKVSNFIFASSSSVYGNKNKTPFSEGDLTDFPISPYGATKKTGELLAHTYHHNFGLPVTCLRIFNAYGENNRPELVMYKWTEDLFQNKTIEISGDGSRARDYTYIGDIVSGIIKAIERKNGYEIINLGNSNPISLKKLLKILEEKIGSKATVRSRESAHASVEETCADIRKAKKVLDWEPKVKIEEGISLLVSWFKKNRLK